MQNLTIKSVDHMKNTKDVVRNPPSQARINALCDLSVELGANYIAIATPYDNPQGGDSIALTEAWLTAARARNLKVWHRHMGLSFEGIYEVTKVKNLSAYTQQIVDYITAHPSQFRNGDIFTPTPEPDSAGISGVTGTNGIPQFSSSAEFNSWIQTTQTAVKAAFVNIGKSVSVGYYGFSSFIVWGENNADWEGKGFLTQATVDACDGIIAMDTYPESFGGSMENSLLGAQHLYSNARIVIGEWGTITAQTNQQAVDQVNSALSAARNVDSCIGINYWNMGPSSHESLVDSNLAPLPSYYTLQSYYTQTFSTSSISASVSPSPSASNSSSPSPSSSVSSSPSASTSRSISPSPSLGAPSPSEPPPQGSQGNTRASTPAIGYSRRPQGV